MLSAIRDLRSHTANLYEYSLFHSSTGDTVRAGDIRGLYDLHARHSNLHLEYCQQQMRRQKGNIKKHVALPLPLCLSCLSVYLLLFVCPSLLSSFSFSISLSVRASLSLPLACSLDPPCRTYLKTTNINIMYTKGQNQGEEIIRSSPGGGTRDLCPGGHQFFRPRILYIYIYRYLYL